MTSPDSEWKIEPNADGILKGLVDMFLSGNRYARDLSRKIEGSTSTRFADWIDHIRADEGRVDVQALVGSGWSKTGSDDITVLRSSSSIIPPILVGGPQGMDLAISVENIDEFARVNSLKAPIDGERLAPCRTMDVRKEGDLMLKAVERRGDSGFSMRESDDLNLYQGAIVGLLKRRRDHPDPDDGIKELQGTFDELLKEISGPRLADAFFRAERQYWLHRNPDGAFQRSRQDRIGLGLSNTDHHTYRCSRERFGRSLKLLRSLGMVRRETFRAGEEAGWGAQVMEHPITGSVVFADVDMGPEESVEDVISGGGKGTDRPGTVGLWVEIHGESVMEAGLHHVAVRSSFLRMRADLKKEGIDSMDPFSDLPHLRQCFTKAARWGLSGMKCRSLADAGIIDRPTFERFLSSGVPGSHMEIIERNFGYKGFNQGAVSDIIRGTDPRTYDL